MDSLDLPVADLVQGAQHGEVEAWATLVDGFQGVAVGLAFGWSGDWDTAADVAQEALMLAFPSTLGNLKIPRRSRPGSPRSCGPPGAAWRAGASRNWSLCRSRATRARRS